MFNLAVERLVDSLAGVVEQDRRLLADMPRRMLAEGSLFPSTPSQFEVNRS